MDAERNLIKLREEFIASVANDLRNPLFSLMGYLDLLNNGNAGDPQAQEEFIERASKDASRLLVMVNELLDFSLLESQSLALNWEKVDIVAIVQDVVESFRDQAEAKRITLMFSPKISSQIVDLDSSRMRRVLANLVENAIKFSEINDRIMVTVEPVDSSIAINVMDQGCGIPKEDRLKIFEKYYQVSHASKKNNAGTGLGLYIAKQIVDAHGGEITVESRLNAGSKFTVTLPVSKSV
jgi:signal transduction histidine kinase